jgi:hypothetical protein
MTSCQDSRALQHCFSYERLPTLWHALPAIEALQTAWEAKRNDPHFAIYLGTISKGLSKLQKYYSWFDEKPSYVLALDKRPSFASELILPCKTATFIRITNSNISRWHGAVQKSRQRKSMLVI